jgi:hypothetical protein
MVKPPRLRDPDRPADIRSPGSPEHVLSARTKHPAESSCGDPPIAGSRLPEQIRPLSSSGRSALAALPATLLWPSFGGGKICSSPSISSRCIPSLSGSFSKDSQVIWWVVVAICLEGYDGCFENSSAFAERLLQCESSCDGRCGRRIRALTAVCSAGQSGLTARVAINLKGCSSDSSWLSVAIAVAGVSTFGFGRTNLRRAERLGTPSRGAARAS